MILVERGEPVRLPAPGDRRLLPGVFPDFQCRSQPPEGELIPVGFTPEQHGEYEFTCGMSMLRGKLAVRWVRQTRIRRSAPSIPPTPTTVPVAQAAMLSPVGVDSS